MKFEIHIILVLLCILVVPASTHARDTDLEVSGWIPYWRDSEGIKDAKKHLGSIDIVYPFAFTVTTKGELRDQAGLDKKDWKSFVKTAQKKDVKIVPTVMWSDGASTFSVLSNPTTRTSHVNEIANMVEKGGYDGVDIDYEGKVQGTKESFSAFLTELREALGDEKILSCTIEPRTPPSSLYKDVPETMKYINDYAVIGDVCDRVVIMAYDQQRADIKLNTERMGKPYMPLADKDWVEKVIEETLKGLPKEKVVLGIASYGHHYAVSVAPNWYRDYWKLGAMNVPDILDVAKREKVTPSRNDAGEMSFTYLPKGSSHVNFKGITIPKDTPKGMKVGAQALAYANKTGKEVIFNIGWYSDAEAMNDKIKLAKKYNLLGVSLFKIDGEEDQKVWKYLEPISH